MKIFRAFPIQQPSFETVDGGGGGGAAAGSGSGAGGTAPGGAAAGAGSGGSAPVSLSDSTPITIEGKATTWGEYRQSNFVPKADYDGVNSKFTTFQNNLRNLAANLKNNPNFNKQPGGQPRVDPLAALRGQPIVSGDELAKLAEQGFGAMAQRIDQQQKSVAAIMSKLTALEKGVGGVHERNAQGDFAKRIDGVIGQLGEGF